MRGEFEFVRHNIIKLYRDKVSALRLGCRRSVHFAMTEPGGRHHSALTAPRLSEIPPTEIKII